VNVYYGMLRKIRWVVVLISLVWNHVLRYEKKKKTKGLCVNCGKMTRKHNMSSLSMRISAR
jgi:hypothetical protein